jgi:hypothetical protein
MKRIESLDILTNKILIIIGVSSVLFFIYRFGCFIAADAEFKGYYPYTYTSHTINTGKTTIYYTIVGHWIHGQDETAFTTTTDVDEFYKACDRFNVYINKKDSQYAANTPNSSQNNDY